MKEKVVSFFAGIGAIGLYIALFLAFCFGVNFVFGSNSDGAIDGSSAGIVSASNDETTEDDVDTAASYAEDSGSYDTYTDSSDFSAEESNCNPNYDPCVEDSSYDLDCADIGEEVEVVGYDEYGLDRDGDGWGCEAY